MPPACRCTMPETKTTKTTKFAATALAQLRAKAGRVTVLAGSDKVKKVEHAFKAAARSTNTTAKRTTNAK